MVKSVPSGVVSRITSASVRSRASFSVDPPHLLIIGGNPAADHHILGDVAEIGDPGPLLHRLPDSHRMGQAVGGLVDHHLRGGHCGRNRRGRFRPPDLLGLHCHDDHFPARRNRAVREGLGNDPGPVGIGHDDYRFPLFHLDDLVDKHVCRKSHSGYFHRTTSC